MAQRRASRVGSPVASVTKTSAKRRTVRNKAEEKASDALANWRSWLLALLLVAGVVIAVIHWGDVKKFAALVAHSKPLWLVAMLPPARLVEAMVAAGWPVSAAFLFSATLVAVPALRERAQRLIDAQRCRGLTTRGGPLVRLRALRALALPLVLSALHEVDERALALETRGLTAGARRTALAPPADHWTERLLRWALVLLCVLLTVWRAA